MTLNMTYMRVMCDVCKTFPKYGMGLPWAYARNNMRLRNCIGN